MKNKNPVILALLHAKRFSRVLLFYLCKHVMTLEELLASLGDG
jgi:hypothetical protein